MNPSLLPLALPVSFGVMAFSMAGAALARSRAPSVLPAFLSVVVLGAVMAGYGLMHAFA